MYHLGIGTLVNSRIIRELLRIRIKRALSEFFQKLGIIRVFLSQKVLFANNSRILNFWVKYSAFTLFKEKKKIPAQHPTLPHHLFSVLTPSHARLLPPRLPGHMRSPPSDQKSEPPVLRALAMESKIWNPPGRLSSDPLPGRAPLAS